MSQHILPDDLRDWPDDPYALLGVPHDVDAKGVRRAYTALVRRYKPEHAPDAFQRIRSAYEEVSRCVAWRREPSEEEDAASDGEAVSPNNASGAASSESSFDLSSPAPSSPGSSSEPLRTRPVPDDADAAKAAWKTAASGNWENAWQRLRGLDDRSPGNPDVAHRLHWLKTLRPGLANGDASHNGEGRIPATPGLRAMFLTEMRRSLEVAYSADAEAWWTAPLSSWERAQFVRARWAAAARTDGFRRIEADIDRAQRFLRDDRDDWFDLLVMGIGLALLGRYPQGDTCRRRLEALMAEMTDLQFAHAHELEKLDLARMLVKHLIPMPAPQDGTVMRMAIRSLFFNPAETREELEDEIAVWTQRPIAGLTRLDTLGGRDPAFPWLVSRLVSQYAGERGLEAEHPGTDAVMARLEEDEALVTSMGHARLFGGKIEHAGDTRLLLLSFCLREGIRLGHVLDTAARVMVNGVPQFEPLCDALRDDVALFAVTEGVLAFWKVG